jgi:hypothetical protein
VDPVQGADTDRRGMPFLSTVLDWLDSYDTGPEQPDRPHGAGALPGVGRDRRRAASPRSTRSSRPAAAHVPRSGSVEVHNQSVTWERARPRRPARTRTPNAAGVLTLAAAGSGLAKTWLAEPDGANRATSLTMAEPVRRRVAGVQNDVAGVPDRAVRYAMDQAVAAGRLPKMVTSVPENRCHHADPGIGDGDRDRAGDRRGGRADHRAGAAEPQHRVAEAWWRSGR